MNDPNEILSEKGMEERIAEMERDEVHRSKYKKLYFISVKERADLLLQLAGYKHLFFALLAFNLVGYFYFSD